MLIFLSVHFFITIIMMVYLSVAILENAILNLHIYD